MDYWYLILVVPALLIAVVAQIRVKSVFARYSRVPVRCGMSGAEASRFIQRQNGINVPIRAVSGSMTDFYDPKSNSISLSDTVRDQTSVAAVGVAAHETGHALQYANDYFPVRLRMGMVPVTNFASSISPVLIVLGLMLSLPTLAYIGIALFSMAVLFQLVTLPVEFNASARAVRALEQSGSLSDEELRGVRRVLSAAAMTYVAAMLVSLMNLLRLIAIVAGNGNRRRR